MFYFISFITIVLAVLYACLMLYFRVGWLMLAYFNHSKTNGPKQSYSILVPARNEESNIEGCLMDIIGQGFPKEHFEIIVVDDFSEDGTVNQVEKIIAEHPEYTIRLLKMGEMATNERNSFKKAGLTAGIGHSKHDWIITSDADCRRGKDWLAAIDAFIQINAPVMVSAPVAFRQPKNFFEKVQALEFSGLVGIGAASMAQGSPNMCNGANLIFKKEAFDEVGGYTGNDDIASGDDEFLMHKIHARWPGKVQFLKNTEAVAWTLPATNMPQFIQQRKRWVSKSRKYENKNITAILVGAYLFHACLLICLAGSFFNTGYLVVFCLAFGMKTLSEFSFLYKITRFFGQQNLLAQYIPAAFLYIFYVLYIGIYGNFGTYEWKGRKVK